MKRIERTSAVLLAVSVLVVTFLCLLIFKEERKPKEDAGLSAKVDSEEDLVASLKSTEEGKTPTLTNTEEAPVPQIVAAPEGNLSELRSTGKPSYHRTSFQSLRGSSSQPLRDQAMTKALIQKRAKRLTPAE